MRIAVAVNEFGKISSHLGKATIFFIFTLEKSKAIFVEKRDVEGNFTNHIIDDIKDCCYVISSKIGEGMKENLIKMGIIPIVEIFTDNPKEAVEKIKGGD
ncbi:MAG: hypothetical protein PWP46_946 [Fusobacteriaceae bacterium]|jgi:predicted Fe-Mo cluster-binding NifX family protein|nr:Dinitrogenase iron-molybdenum cofactor biosynthesis protein [Fusobacteriales bacterium]MDN5304067.1 hypothetical protein [Fusobacteriaceae bacterium]